MNKGQQPAGQTTNTQTVAPYMYPYMGTIGDQATQLYQTGGPQYYPGQQVAGFSQPQQQAMQGTLNLGLNGTPALSSAQNFDTMLTQGGGSNPWLDKTFNQAANASQNRLASEFAGSGMDVRNSAPLRAQQLDQLATGIYGNNYQNTLQNALQAGNQAQNLYQTQLGGLGAAQNVGQQVQNLAQQQINANQGKYNYYQNLPYQNLQNFQQTINGMQPGLQTSSPYFTNPSANLLGTALAGEQLYNAWPGKGGSSSSTPSATSTGSSGNSWVGSGGFF